MSLLISIYLPEIYLGLGFYSALGLCFGTARACMCMCMHVPACGHPSFQLTMPPPPPPLPPNIHASAHTTPGHSQTPPPPPPRARVCLATPLTRLSRVYNSTARALGPLHTPDSAARPAARSTETPEGRPHTNRDPASRASGSPGYLGLGCRKRAETQHGASATAEARRAAPPRPLVLAAASRPPPPCACSALLVLRRLARSRRLRAERLGRVPSDAPNSAQPRL